MPVASHASLERRKSALHASVSSGAEIFVLTYSGLGDTVIFAPIIISLSRLIGRRVWCVDTQMLRSLLLRSQAMRDSATPIDRRFNRPSSYTLDDVGRLRHEFNVGVVVNFRRDFLDDDNRYQQQKRMMEAHGIVVIDFCDVASPTEQATVHVAALSDKLLAAYELAGAPAAHWLAGAETESPRGPQAVVAAYFGSSVEHKRLPSSFWVNVVEGLAREANVGRVILIPGHSAQEGEEGGRILRALAPGATRFEYVDAANIDDILTLLPTVDLLISPDTFMVHLADAVRVPVVAVHCSTDPAVYGPRGKRTRSVLGTFYHSCPGKNLKGNCTAWDTGCSHMRCRGSVPVEEVLEASRQLIRSNTGVENYD